MITDFSKRLTYFGTLDDVVYRYPWDRPITREALQQQLVTAAIYDKRVLINDGYLLANPLLFGELVDISKSLTGNMMRNGNARLFARGGKVNIAEGIEARADKIATHARVVRDRSQWTALREQLEFLSAEVERFTIPWPRDKNMGHIFYLLMIRIRDRVLAQAEKGPLHEKGRIFLAVFERFENTIDKSSFDAARSIWEQQCWIALSGAPVDPNALLAADRSKLGQLFPGYEAIRPLMNVANEMYHLAYSLGAYRSIQADDPGPEVDRAAIGVTTALFGEHPGLIEAEEADDATTDGKQLAALNQLLLTVPAGLRFKDDFAAISGIRYDQASRAAQRDYLAGLRRFVEGRASFDETRRLQATYRRELARVLTPMVQDRMVDALATTLMAPVNFALDKVSAGLGWIAALVIGVDRCENRMIERLLRVHVENALMEQGIEATQQRNAPSLASRYGLYFGPVDTTGADRILDQVKPHPRMVSVSAPTSSPA